ncbi:MAG: C4-dicarboxylate TRAP transporter substrate-binding protein [Burkholderiales bacterium]|nr:C4-dicarboxylate TRAP transporter substrate-binding protein [Burkholderiales bacterium]
MKVLKRLAILAVASVLTVGVAAAQTLRYSDYSPNRGSRAAALEWFAEQVKSRTEGRVKIEFHWGGALLSGKATLKGLGDGVADAGTVIGFFTPKELKAYNMGDLPVDNSDAWIGLRAIYDVASSHAAMRKEFDKAGVVYISNFTTGPIQLICVPPVASLAELKGKKVRGSGPYGKAMGDLGAITQSMSQADVYQGLDSGLLDCNQNYYYATKSYKQYEVAPNMLVLDWGQNLSFGIFMSKIAFDGLAAKDRAVLRDVGKDFIDHIARVMIEEADSDKAQLQAGIGGKKVTLRTLPAAERATLLAAGKKYIQAWVAEATASGIDGAGLLADYEARIAHYAAEKKAKNYPWAR